MIILAYLMLHTKFQGHRPFGSREDDFLRFLPKQCLGTGTRANPIRTVSGSGSIIISYYTDEIFGLFSQYFDEIFRSATHNPAIFYLLF